ADDANYAGVTTRGNTQATLYLKATGFGFSVQAGATVNGIPIEWKMGSGGWAGSATDYRVIDNAVRIIKGGTVGSTDRSHSNTTYWPADPSSTGDGAYVSYGNSSDLWGLAWTPADINSST